VKHIPSPLAQKAIDHYTALLRPVFAERKFLLAGPIAVALGGLARQLVSLDAGRPFLVAGTEGTGTMPTSEQAEVHMLGIQGTDVLTEHRRLDRALDDLPADVLRAIDAWDPDGTARCILASALAGSRTVARRRSYGMRPPAWQALEDKVRIDAFWDAVGVPRAPSRIVAADYPAIRNAADELNRGSGTVWAADARDGLNGGGLGLRWVRPGDDGRRSFEFLSGIADRVRVMPFLEGIPASIHGIVFPDAVAVFRPVEMIVFRPAGGDRLFYAGCATAFDPRLEDRAAMRRLARRVGTALRERVGYRGPFGIDGILADEGFVPTEMNPRAGAALGPLSRGVGDLPLTPLCRAAIEGEPLDYRGELLEEAIVEAADRHRTTSGWFATRRKIADNGTLEVVREDGEYREVRSGEEPDGTFQFGPGPVGGFIRFTVRPERVEPGPSSAPDVARALRFADRAFGTELGLLEAATDVRP